MLSNLTKKKRRPIEKSTGETDPKLAAKFAIDWVKKIQVMEVEQERVRRELRNCFGVFLEFFVLFPEFVDCFRTVFGPFRCVFCFSRV